MIIVHTIAANNTICVAVFAGPGQCWAMPTINSANAAPGTLKPTASPTHLSVRADGSFGRDDAAMTGSPSCPSYLCSKYYEPFRYMYYTIYA